tara:strand:- start:487 stop:939 length:453 start_codon:yes stop_codon:yes gene_type:complete
MTKIRGVEASDHSFLRDQIKHHFGSFSVFSRVTGLPYRRTLEVFTKLKFNKKDFDRINVAFKKNVDKDNIPCRISEIEREKIRFCILTSYRNFSEFFRKHPEYDVVYLSNITRKERKQTTKKKKQGRLKLKTTKYARLVNLLTERYGLEV